MVRGSAFALLVLLSACAVGPDYHAPATPAVAPRNLATAHFDSRQRRIRDWWQAFPDPELARLEQRALAANLDVAEAVEHVRAARAAFTEANLSFAPHVPLELEYQRSKEQEPGFTTDRIDIASYTAGFDASWELDLFGHVRRSAQAAGAQLGLQQATLADTRVSVAAEVARNYFELRGAQRQLAVAQDNIANQREALRLTQIRYDAGRVTELDVDSAQARLKATEATVPLLESAEKRAAYRLAVLLAVSPGDSTMNSPRAHRPRRR